MKVTILALNKLKIERYTYDEMHYYDYKNDELYCEDVPLTQIAQQVGTPFYVYSHAILQKRYNLFAEAFKGTDHLICFSLKSNASQAILKTFANMGAGLDIVSGGELYRGLKAGFDPAKIVYSGVGKRPDEIDFALNSGIKMFNVESMDELEMINARAGELGKKAAIAIRVNPNVDPKTHPYISTGLKKNKFGISIEGAYQAYAAAKNMPNIEIAGIDCHIGSQLTEVQPFADALSNILELVDRMQSELGIALKYIDMGGGLGIKYDDEQPPTPDEYAQAVLKQLKGRNLSIILEPGRNLVGNAGVLVTKVLYQKSNDVKNFVIIDAGMNDLIRPTLYEAYHKILPVKERHSEKITADIVGPICETGDFLAADREIEKPQNGDLLAVMSAGAYGMVMASNYCSRLRAAEVMVKGDKFEVVRQRETYEDLTRGESIPDFL